jgi:ABC-type transporter Mla subunit MlaD
MLDWRDSLQRRLPGFRERMVHIGLAPEVGGLHLAMKPATIFRLARLGVVAADQLQRDFATAPQTAGRANAWERHRWTRARTSLSALHAHLAAFASRLHAGEPTYDRLLHTADPPAHPFASEAARSQALALMEGTAELMQTVDATSPNTAMDEHSPEPRPELHLSPPW